MTKEELIKKAENIAARHFFCNVDDDNFPKDIYAALSDGLKEGEELEAWEPFENHNRSWIFQNFCLLVDTVVAEFKDEQET